MGDLIMRKRADEIFIEGIQETEGQLLVMIFTEERVFGKIGQGVMHPAHIPFHSKSQAA